ncbi:MAG: hypothetical protein FWE13_03040 [Firmicutes bacterium]|nr:hypothetical protein [Bacillota bacterium]
MEGVSQEEVRKEMETALVAAYKSGNFYMRMIKDDNSMPTVEECLAYIAREVEKKNRIEVLYINIIIVKIASASWQFFLDYKNFTFYNW